MGGGCVASSDGSRGLTGHGTVIVHVKEGVNSASIGRNAKKSEDVKEEPECSHGAKASVA